MAYDSDRLDAYCAEAFQKIDDVFAVTGEAVSVELFLNGRNSGIALFVFVEDQFECKSATEGYS